MPEYEIFPDTLTIVCAWCRELLGYREARPGVQGVSHGICPACALRSIERRSYREVLIEVLLTAGRDPASLDCLEAITGYLYREQA